MSRPPRAQRVLPALLVLTCWLAAAAAPASASVPNACQYNYDSYYRDTPFTLAGTPTVKADAPRYPADGTVADPGQKIVLAGAPIQVSLPDNLAEFGYRSGLLSPGLNSNIPVKVWVAISATNTLERVQVQEFTLTANTTIVTDSDDHWVSDDGINFTAPVLADSTWTAVGGDVRFSQAGPGSLGVLPVGPRVPAGTGPHANRTVAGSVVVQADVGYANGPVSFYMDCQPGAVDNPAATDLAGPTFTPGTAAPFDTAVTGPRNIACISSQGRLVAGAAAQLPTGPPPPEPDREIDPISVTLAATAPAATTVGTPYALTGGTAHIRLSAGTVATLANFQDAGNPLIVADKAYPLDTWIAIQGSNTVEGIQTVHVQGTYALHPVGGGNWDAYDATINLPQTTWTPAAAGPTSFSVAPPGSISSIAVIGSAASDPLAGAAAPYAIAPYGSVVLRAATEINPATFDCFAGFVKITGPLVAFSNLGRTGSGGRYSLTANPAPPVFATSTASAPVPPPVPPPPPAVPPPPPPPVPPPPPPVTIPPAGPGTIVTTSLRVRAARIGFEIRCSDTRKRSCSGVLSARSALKLRVGKRSKVVTIVRDKRYTVAAGKRKKLTLALTREARSVLAKRRSLRVKIALKRSGVAKAVTRTVTLSR